MFPFARINEVTRAIQSVQIILQKDRGGLNGVQTIIMDYDAVMLTIAHRRKYFYRSLGMKKFPLLTHFCSAVNMVKIPMIKVSTLAGLLKILIYLTKIILKITWLVLASDFEIKWLLVKRSIQIFQPTMESNILKEITMVRRSMVD